MSGIFLLTVHSDQETISDCTIPILVTLVDLLLLLLLQQLVRFDIFPEDDSNLFWAHRLQHL